MKLRKDMAGLLAAGAAALLLFGTAGASRAALAWFSEDYVAHMEIDEIGVTLMENGGEVSSDGGDGSLAAHLLDGEADGLLKPGKAYGEALAVRNSGEIDEYVRVTVRRYWTDGNGKKTDVDPGYIGLGLPGNGWVLDEGASTPERLVLYYTEALSPGEASEPLSDTLTVSTDILKDVHQVREDLGDGKTLIRTEWPYDGIQMNLEAETDAVQAHNAEAAVRSAWGVDVEIAEDGTLSLAGPEGEA